MSKIIYISNTPRNSDFNEIVSKNLVNVAASNYNFQIMTGLVKIGFEVLSIYDYPILENNKGKNTSDISYQVNGGKLNSLYFYQSSIKYKYGVIKELIKNDDEKPLVICDPLSLKNSIIILILKLKYKLKTIAIITDLPRFFYSKKNHTLKDLVFSILGEISLFFFDAFVLISKHIRKEKFIRNKKSIVIEGVFEDEISVRTIVKKESTIKKCLYSGTISKENGILTMMEAFSKLDENDCILEIYSSDRTYTEFEELLNEKVIFKGYLDRKSLKKVQSKTYLLINPRPTTLPYIKYSFPSKLIEYMSSGVPTLTTKLSSIPEEFNDCLFYFSGETVEDMKNDLKKILSLDASEMNLKAKKAQDLIFNKYLSEKVAKEIVNLVR